MVPKQNIEHIGVNDGTNADETRALQFYVWRQRLAEVSEGRHARSLLSVWHWKRQLKSRSCQIIMKELGLVVPLAHDARRQCVAKPFWNML